MEVKRVEIPANREPSPTSGRNEYKERLGFFLTKNSQSQNKIYNGVNNPFQPSKKREKLCPSLLELQMEAELP